MAVSSRSTKKKRHSEKGGATNTTSLESTNNNNGWNTVLQILFFYCMASISSSFTIGYFIQQLFNNNNLLVCICIGILSLPTYVYGMDLVDDDNSMEMVAPLAAAGAGAVVGAAQTIVAPKRGMNFMKVFAFLVGLGQVYEKGTKAGNALIKGAVGYLDGKHTCDGTSIPGSPGLFDNDDGEVASFWEGIPLIFIAPAFKDKMKQMMTFINCPGFEGLKKMYEWVYHVGFLDGDGSLYGKLTVVSNPRIKMSIGGFTSYHKLLVKYYGFRSSNKKKAPVKSTAVNRGLDCFLSKVGFLPAFKNAITLKKAQFDAAIAVALPSHLASNSRYNATMATDTVKQTTNQFLSHLNHIHGNNYTIDYFRKLFNDMIEYEKVQLGENNNVKTVPLLFLMYVAGLIGADGGVGYANYCFQIQIFQSCLPYLFALADAIKEVMGFKDPVKVQEYTGSIDKQPANSRGKFRIVFTKEQSMQLLFTVGALDYNRRGQYVVAQVAALVDCCDEFHNKEKVMEFLRDLGKLVRIFYPSKGWRWALFDSNGNYITTFFNMPCPQGPPPP